MILLHLLNADQVPSDVHLLVLWDKSPNTETLVKFPLQLFLFPPVFLLSPKARCNAAGAMGTTLVQGGPETAFPAHTHYFKVGTHPLLARVRPDAERALACSSIGVAVSGMRCWVAEYREATIGQSNLSEKGWSRSSRGMVIVVHVFSAALNCGNRWSRQAKHMDDDTALKWPSCFLFFQSFIPAHASAPGPVQDFSAAKANSITCVHAADSCSSKQETINVSKLICNQQISTRRMGG